MNLQANKTDTIHSSFTGVRVSDEYAIVSYDALRIANAKMIELEYEKEINKNLKEIIYNDSIIISEYKTYIDDVDLKYNRKIKTLKKDLAISTGCGISCLALLILALL